MTRRRASPGQLQLAFADDPHQIVTALASRVGRERHDARCVPELGLSSGMARIDLAVVDDRLAGYEIKGRRDDLDRLPRQAEAFGQVFEQLTLVTTANHLRRASEVVPEWWGIEVVEETGSTLTCIRPTRANPGRRLDILVRLLWRDEAVSLLRTAGHTRVHEPRLVLWERLLTTFDETSLSRAVHETLKQRSGWRAAA